jgi:hypothetical protein
MASFIARAARRCNGRLASNISFTEALSFSKAEMKKLDATSR